ncbi:MAG: HlyD family type I secretion periplasmic adaptor subunit [Brevundimonas sp.]|uniref:HlyD family type I secretion periplasmic adaptor subunit n=1 Tax=Brevundimonas sp. TaxID=1871086 RepID=UPI00391DD7C3
MTSTSSPLPEKTPELSPSPRFELWLGGAIIVLFFGLFLGWAAFAPLDAGAYASGQVMVSGNRQAVQHPDGGVVSVLHVAEADRVERGQVLVEISAGNLRAVERGVAGQVYALLAQRARMIAERDRLSAVPTPEAYAALSGEDRTLAEEALTLQRRQFAARGAGRSTESGVLRQRISQLEDRMGGYQRQLESNREQQRLIQEELTGMRSLAAQGYAPVNRVRALERTAASLEGEEGALIAQIAAAREQIGETRLQMLGVNTRLDEDVADQLRQVEVQLNELQPRLSELQAQIARTQVRSPAGGQVVGLSVFTPGGVVQPGQVLMEIVPDDASQVLVAQVDPADIDNVRVGLQTEVRFPGLREEIPPIVRGEVTSVSADSFTNEQNGHSYFRVEVVVPPQELEALGSAARGIRPGMPVEVVILLRRRTALSYLVEPLTRNLWRSGSQQ